MLRIIMCGGVKFQHWYEEEEGGSGGSWQFWRKQAVLVEAGGSGGSRRSWRKPAVLEEAGGSGGNRRFWRKPAVLEEAGGSGSCGFSPVAQWLWF